MLPAVNAHHLGVSVVLPDHVACRVKKRATGQQLVSPIAVDVAVQGNLCRVDQTSGKRSSQGNGVVPVHILTTDSFDATTPTEPSATALRWCTERQHLDVTMATLLTPGSAAAEVSLSEGASGHDITAGSGDWRKTFTLSTGGTGIPQLSIP